MRKFHDRQKELKALQIISERIAETVLALSSNLMIKYNGKWEKHFLNLANQ